MEIKAIETEYAGCRFRSRLEARWAVFFDAYGVVWMYEPQGYEIGEDRYLPDFWLPEIGVWVEVKGRFTAADWAKTRDAVWGLPARPDHLPFGRRATLTPELAVFGELPGEQTAPHACHLLLSWGLGPGREPVVAANAAAWRAPTNLMPFNRSWLASTITESDANDFLSSADNLWLTPNPSAAQAFAKARRARFEHGEQG